VRYAIYLVLLAACDLKPAPKQSPPPPKPPAAVPVVFDAGAGADALMEVTQPCVDVGVKVATIWIETSTSPTEKAQLEQERTKMVRRMAENCTKGSWDDAIRGCMLAATTRAALQQCQLPPPPAPAPTNG
jgi:hypothetical protein